MNNIEYRQILLNELDKRKQQNNSYSLRAFARDLGIAAPTLSDILKGKKGLSHKSAERIACQLRLKEHHKNLFVQSVLARHGRSVHLRNLAQDQLNLLLAQTEYPQIDLEKFQIISDWYYFAILELCETNTPVKSANDISRRLNLNIETVENALKALESLNLIEFKNEMWKQTHKDLTTPADIPSTFIRQNHLQIMKKAEESLMRDNVRDRDFSNITLALSSDQIDYAKKEIEKFCHRLSGKLNESNQNKDRVYSLTVQLFPLDFKIDNGDNK